MKLKLKKILPDIIYPFAAVGIIVALWAIFAAAIDMELIVPSIGSTFDKLGNLLTGADFYRALGNTLLRTAASFFTGALAALLLSLVSLKDSVRKFLSPVIKIVRSVPTMSVILLTVIWMKPATSPIFVAFLINFPIMYSGFYSAFSGVDKDLVAMSKVYGVKFKNRLFELYLPAIAPAAFDCMQSSIGLTVKIVISAEVIAQTRYSMGIAMQMARGYLETAELLAWTLAAVVLSYILELLIFAIKKAFVRWK